MLYLFSQRKEENNEYFCIMIKRFRRIKSLGTKTEKKYPSNTNLHIQRSNEKVEKVKSIKTTLSELL